jgi:hypothetical protein
MSLIGTRAAISRAIDLDRALIDPAATFGSPDAVVLDPRLPKRTKIEIFCRWAYDSAELSVAEEEGMDGGESTDMGAILKALDQITEIDVEHCAPTKHAAFCVASAARSAQPSRVGQGRGSREQRPQIPRGSR